MDAAPRGTAEIPPKFEGDIGQVPVLTAFRPIQALELERMTTSELLDAAAQKLTEAATLLDRAGEERLAADATELAERVNLRIAMN